MKLIKYFFHLIAIIILTVLTQIGGVVWLFSFILISSLKVKSKKLIFIMSFIVLYFLATFLLVPPLAKMNGRVQLPLGYQSVLKPANFIYPLLNRNYVKTELNQLLLKIAIEFEKDFPDSKVKYLDANFPFIQGFPLLPHLSHDDGEKVDLCFFYLDQDGNQTNKKPSFFVYGSFTEPVGDEVNQNEICKNQGFWQYDLPQYLNISEDNSLSFDEIRTKSLLVDLINEQSIGKIFIEPHLKSRMGFKDELKIRYQGCHSVRHDDHIHLQLR